MCIKSYINIIGVCLQFALFASKRIRVTCVSFFHGSITWLVTYIKSYVNIIRDCLLSLAEWKLTSKVYGDLAFVSLFSYWRHGPLTRDVKLRIAHAPGMLGTFSPPSTSRKPLVCDPGMHHGTCVTPVPWCMSGSLTHNGGENVPGIPGACTIRNFTYLVKGPWLLIIIIIIGSGIRSLHVTPLLKIDPTVDK